MNATQTRTARLLGDTYQIRAVLKDHGWKWNASAKVWQKAGDWTDEADVVRSVRLYGGVRNRGSFTAEFVS